MIRILAALALLTGLAACSDVPADLSEAPVALGDFKLGHAEVVAPNPQKLLVSKEASAEEWVRVMDAALEQRFRRYDGDQFYHIGVSVEAYSLPPPVIPGKSALAINVTLWRDADQSKMNAAPETIHVIKVFESRLSKTRGEQMKGLALEAALLIEKWMRENQAEQGWFGGLPAADDPAAAATQAPQPEPPEAIN